jgi:uncharacterized protein (DUF2267 family)
MSTGLPVFDTTIQQTNEWLVQIGERLPPCSRQQAYGALRSVLHALRDRLPHSVMLGLCAQLPLLIRGVMIDGWRAADTPYPARSGAEFEAHVSRELPPGFPRTPADAIEAVLAVLCERVDANEAVKVTRHLPSVLRAYFPAYLPTM